MSSVRDTIISDFGRTSSGRRVCSKTTADLLYDYCIEPNAGIIPESAFEKITQNPDRRMRQLVNARPEFCDLSEDGNELHIRKDYLDKIRKIHEELYDISNIVDLKAKDTLKVGFTETEEGILLDDRFEYVRFYHYVTNPKNEVNFLFNEKLEKQEKIDEADIEKLKTIKVRIVHDIVKYHFVVTKQIVCPRCSTINILSQSKIETMTSIKCRKCGEQTLNTTRFKPKDILPYYLYEGVIYYEDGEEQRIDIESFSPLAYGTYWLQGYFQVSTNNPLKFISISNKRYSQRRPFEWVDEDDGVKENNNIYFKFIKSLRKHVSKANLPLKPDKASLPVFVESLKLFIHALSDGTFTLSHSFYLTGPDVGKTYPVEVVNSLYYNNIPDMTIDASRFTIPGLTGTTYDYKIQDESITLFVPGALSREFILWEEMMNENFLNPRSKDNPQELVKSTLLKDFGNVTMKGGEKFDRNAVISAAGNYFDQHVTEYTKIVNRYYRRYMQSQDPDIMSKSEFMGVPEGVDLFKELEFYQDPVLKRAIKSTRDEFERRGKDWASGIQLPLIQRFFFYYKLSPDAAKIKLDLDFKRYKEMAIDKAKKVDLLTSLYVSDLKEQIKEKCQTRDKITDDNIQEFEDFAREMKKKYKSLNEITRFDEILYRIIETLFLASNESYLTDEVKELIETFLKLREKVCDEEEYHQFVLK